MRSFPFDALRTCSGFFVLATFLALVGCGGGGGTGTVSGKVTYKGNPVKGGRVVFSSEKGKSLLSPISEDGSYRIERVPSGTVKIAVQTKELGVIAGGAGKGGVTGPPKDKGAPPKGISGPMPGKMTPEEAARKFVAIPAHYEDAETSKLTYTVKSGSQEHNITLEGNLSGAK